MKKDTKTENINKLKDKKLQKKIVCKVIRINPDEKDFDMDIEIGRIYNHIKKSSEKSLIDKISKRLSELEFKSNHLIKSKCMLSKKYCHHYKTCKSIV